MIGALLLSIIPTFIASVLVKKTNLKLKSNYLKLSLYWLTGQYLFTISVFLLAQSLSFLTTGVLLKASVIVLLMLMLSLLFLHKNVLELINKALKYLNHFPILTTAIITAFCLLFSFFFFTPHLNYENSTILTSPVYWDFHWHAALIQNFTLGDNFPPQNEAFAGVVHTYHYFWAVLTGIYSVLGLSLVDAINFYSVVSFFFVLITIVGLSQEFFKNKLTGLIAIALTLTSSSLHFIDYLIENKNENLFSIIKNIFLDTQHPWFASFTTAKHDFYYNGTFFNLFYFIEERQMIIGALYFLISACLLYKRKEIPYFLLFPIGIFMGGFFLWHLHLTISVLLALIFLLIFDDERKETFLILSGFLLIFFAHLIYIKMATASPWFTDTKGFPQLNLGFSDQENKAFSLLHSMIWYTYSYGIKIILFPVSLLLIKFKNKKLFLVFCAFIIPTFLLLNTVQLSPGSIYENHKWLRPMNLFIDLVVAYGVYELFFKRKKYLLYLPGAAVVLLLTISGFIELMPFLNSRPTYAYSKFPSTVSSAITSRTKPDDVFLTEDANTVQLSGRKAFLGDVLGGGLGLNIEKRQEITDEIYDSSNKDSFCTIILNYKIDYVIYDNSIRLLPSYLEKSSYFSENDDHENKITFLDIKKSCKP
ncbi:MAG TPA: hypothetical protein VM077_02130 [Candidatus Limnocylindrales bacterium]|nr:hypothetical protein [Candidatus Limnocylindrales bacterium]